MNNLSGHLGPRCVPCSGLGSVLHIPSGGGRPTRHASRCLCGGTGIDAEFFRRRELDAAIGKATDPLLKRIRSLERLLKLESRSRLTQGKASRQSWEELIAWAVADGTAVANTTTETIIFPNVTLPANYMADGRVLRIYAAGRLSTTGTPTMIWAIRWNGVAGTLLATTEAITMGSGVTNVNWSMHARIQTRTNGATGTLFVMGDLSVHTGATTLVGTVFGVSGYDAPAAVTVDLTADTPLSITADWSAASASNTLTGHMLNEESLN